MGRPGLALRGHPELAPDSRGARSLPRPDLRGPLRGSTALGLPARPPAPGLRLPGAQDPSHAALAPRRAPLTVGSEAGLLGPSPRSRLSSGSATCPGGRRRPPAGPWLLRVIPWCSSSLRDLLAGTAGWRRDPRGRRGPGVAVSAASRGVTWQCRVLILGDVRPKLRPRRAWPWWLWPRLARVLAPGLEGPARPGTGCRAPCGVRRTA